MLREGLSRALKATAALAAAAIAAAAATSSGLCGRTPIGEVLDAAPTPSASTILADPVAGPAGSGEGPDPVDLAAAAAASCPPPSSDEKKDARELYCKGLYYFSIGNLSDSRRLLGTAHEMSPEDVAYAIAYARAGMIHATDGLREVLNKAIAAHPRNAEAWHQRGLLEIHYGEPLRSASYLNRAISLDPENIAIRVSLAWGLARAGEFANARTEWQAVVAHHELTPEWHYKYGWYLHETGDRKAAKEHLEIAARPRKLEKGGWQFWWVSSASTMLWKFYGADRPD